MLKYAVSLPRIRFVQMVVSCGWNLVLWTLAEIDFLPKVCGSGPFTSDKSLKPFVLTLAPMSDTQLVDGLDPYIRNALHHYFSIQWAGRYGAPGRREIGHGSRWTFCQVLPSWRVPLYIRLVAEFWVKWFFLKPLFAGTLALWLVVPIKQACCRIVYLRWAQLHCPDWYSRFRRITFGDTEAAHENELRLRCA